MARVAPGRAPSSTHHGRVHEATFSIRGGHGGLRGDRAHPGIAADVDDGLGRGGGEALAQAKPGAFHRVDLEAVGRRDDERDGARHGEGPAQVPAGTVEDHDDMNLERARRCDVIDEDPALAAASIGLWEVPAMAAIGGARVRPGSPVEVRDRAGTRPPAAPDPQRREGRQYDPAREERIGAGT